MFAGREGKGKRVKVMDGILKGLIWKRSIGKVRVPVRNDLDVVEFYACMEFTGATGTNVRGKAEYR